MLLAPPVTLKGADAGREVWHGVNLDAAAESIAPAHVVDAPPATPACLALPSEISVLLILSWIASFCYQI
jgi:hypothetical protein